ncbi:MAG: flagellar hook-associated protein FlgL [Lamprobacter sp.]|uniref:flagellar hook-associated protein FlgL n=1 Tax=Lamprobacter sp. TaxID=3100796 RepID=UPI002B259C82|nr:flagellar hook-associated protein FlgL [Lamprobacter sp.]MEA3639799.1 flagellar hook-associated protein FlgL [Lamprobacter sp.]
MMRISTVTMYQQSLSSMNRQQSQFLKVGQQIASGRRVMTPADDPQDASRAVRVSQAQTATQQNTDSRVSARNALSQTESVLSGSSDLIIRGKTLLVQAASEILSDSDRKSIASELRGLYETLIGQANSTDGNNHYLFGGYQDEAPPFFRNTDGPGIARIDYRGDDQVREQRVDSERLMPITDNGKTLFQSVSGGTVYVARAEKVGLSAEAIDEIGTQAGYLRNEGTVTFSGPNRVNASDPNFGEAFTLKFGQLVVDASALLSAGNTIDVSEGELTGFTGGSFADSDALINALKVAAEIENVVDRSSAGDGSELVVTFVDDVAKDFTFALTDTNATPNETVAFTNAIQITAVKVEGVDASSLLVDGAVSVSSGSLTNFVSGTYTTPEALISALEEADEILSVFDNSANGDGSDLVINFAEGLPSDFTFELTNAASSDPPVSFTNAATELLGPKDYESGEVLNFAGITVGLEGEPEIGDQIQLRPADDPAANQDLFKTFKDAIDVLELDREGSPDTRAHITNTINTAMRELDNSLDNILTQRASVGARLNELDLVDTVSSNRMLNYDQVMSDLVDLDYGAAVTEYSLRQVGLQAAQRAFVDIQGMSLFDFMR